MPFPPQDARQFNRANIEALTPGQMGVYGLYKEAAWVYIGRGDIRQRLLDHLNGDNPCITLQRPTHFLGEVTSNGVQRERELIIEYDPICNRRVG